MRAHMIAAMSDLAETLAGVPLFSGLAQRDRKRLAKAMKGRTWSAGEVVIEEGKAGVGFWVIEAGTATVTVAGEPVGELGPGDHFGEIALLDDGPRSATVTADRELRCQGIVSWEFAPFVREHPDVAWALLQKLAAMVRDAQAA
jgi:CRP/FNR family transcriptional regulator